MYITKSGLERLKKELYTLETSKLKESAEWVKQADGVRGDEGTTIQSGDVEQAIREFDMLNNRAKYIRNILSDYKVFDTHNLIESPKLELGHTVKLYSSEDDEEFTITLLSDVEACPEDDIIGESSPITKVLLGKSVGEEVEVINSNNTKCNYKIMAYSIRELERFNS